jgi:hypothetical protein
MHIQLGDLVSASVSMKVRNHYMYLGRLPRVVSYKIMCSIFIVMGTILVYVLYDSTSQLTKFMKG